MTLVNSLAKTPPVIDYDTFTSTVRSNATLRVPQGTMEAYKAAQYWKDFQHIEEIPGAGPGDVNGDGQIGVSDVTTLIDKILAGEDVSIYADVNGDGSVSIADVTALIDMLLASQL